MILKSVLLLLAVGSLNASPFDPDTCVTPRLAHGRVRLRQRSRLARFTCLMRYELVGNKYATCRNGRWDVPMPVCVPCVLLGKYATCRNGRWDVPMPVCVRPNCVVPQLQNGLSMLSHGGAWVIFFCFPNHELVGSPVIYCDGVRWNATAPKCVDTTSSPKLSCDFEEPDLCGWKQDALHDFDWVRLNSKTPSSIFLTGPSYDHTLGMGRNGYYMYIESTTQVANDKARLISPVYDHSLAQDGCFSFSYHMFGKTCGGLRVYQKPDNVTLKAILEMPNEEMRTYILFEKWGNLGDTWFNAVSPLTHFSVDFQIVIEGIRGSSYTSDIAIDDVAILQGENCTAAAASATTPAIPTTTVASDSCVNRCVDDYVTKPTSDGRCSCSYACFVQEDCCPDFFAVCLYGDTTETESNASVTVKSVSEEAPQTLKLVAVTTESTTTTITSTSTTTSTTSTTPTTTTQRQTTKPRPKPSTTSSTRPKTTQTTPKTTSRPKTTTPSTTTTTKATTRKFTTTNKDKPSSTYRPIPKKTIKRTTTTTQPVAVSVQVKPLKPTTKTYKASKPFVIGSVEKEKEKELIESRGRQVNRKKVLHEEVKVLPPSGMSSSGKVVLVILVLVSLTATAMMVHVGRRSTRLRVALARLRGHRNRDPEVRYLSSDVDD